MLQPSILNQYDIEESSISTPGTSISTQDDIEETSIVKFKTSKSLLMISTNAPSISVYDIKALCFDITSTLLIVHQAFDDTLWGLHCPLLTLRAASSPPSSAAAGATGPGAAGAAQVERQKDHSTSGCTSNPSQQADQQSAQLSHPWRYYWCKWLKLGIAGH
jgi:hypothetical protein